MSKKSDVIKLYKELRLAGYGKDKTWMDIRYEMYNNLVSQTGVPRASVRRIIGQYRHRCGEKWD